MTQSVRSYLRELYLDWFNNFLSVEGFADYYSINTTDAANLISLARRIYEEEYEMKKISEEYKSKPLSKVNHISIG